MVHNRKKQKNKTKQQKLQRIIQIQKFKKLNLNSTVHIKLTTKQMYTLEKQPL